MFSVQNYTRDLQITKKLFQSQLPEVMPGDCCFYNELKSTFMPNVSLICKCLCTVVCQNGKVFQHLADWGNLPFIYRILRILIDQFTVILA